MMSRVTAMVLAFVLAAAGTYALAVNSQSATTVGGIIKTVSADGKTITVTVGSGTSARDVTVKVVARTQVLADGKAAKAADLKPGASVTVSYDKATQIAGTIRVRAGEAKSPDRKTGKAEPAPSASENAPPPGASDELTKTAAPRSTWTTNLAQMRIPEGRVSGTVLGQEFVIEEARLEGGILKLRQGKDFFADAEISVFMFLKEGEEVAGKKFRVEARESFNVPHIHASTRPKDNAGGGKREQFLNKYAMILEFGRSARGQLPGKIYLCLPDAAKTVVAGHFSVEVFDSTHPLATETLIRGRLTVRGSAAGIDFTLGCVGKNQEGKVESPGGGFQLGGGTNAITSTTWAPRFTTIEWNEESKTGAHRHTNRPPGHYLVYVRGNKQESGDGTLAYEGYYDWKWVELQDEKSNVTADLVIDPANAGTLEVAVVGTTKEKSIMYLPLDPDGNLPLPEAAHWLQSTSSAKLDGGKAVIRGLRPGKYHIAIGPWDRKTLRSAASTAAEVMKGETSSVELAVQASQ